MSQPKLKLITTQDGSHSLMREDMNETYHSFHGALGESKYVFIEMGLEGKMNQQEVKQIDVFEVGFGTGLNAYLAALFANKHRIPVCFHTVEPIPVPQELYSQFNYGDTIEGNALLLHLHDCEWGKEVEISEYFTICKHETTLEALDLKKEFDVIFFDAFAPSKQAEVWSLENIQKCFDLTKPGGGLTTYCAQGQFKRNLAAAGYEVETLKGAMGKKEMVRGLKV